MSAKMWIWILFGCSLLVGAAADDIEGETRSQSLPKFVHQISK